MTEEYQYITVEYDNSIVVISLNRPDIHNAFHPQMITEITNVFQKLSNSYVRAVILTGKGRSFSAGADLNWMKESQHYDYQKNLQDAIELENMFNTIYSCNKPVIAKINGAAFGGGLGLIAACDIAIAIERAKFGFTEVNLGIVPAVISPYVISKIGSMQASRYFITGERFTATAAKEMGLITKVVPDVETLDKEVSSIIENILTSGPKAIATAKKLIHNNRILPFEELRKYCTKTIAEIRTSDEGREGLAAFLEKRKPNWIN